MKKTLFLLWITLAAVMATDVFAYEVPRDDSGAKYFYVFGPEGKAELGALKPQQTLYILVPQESTSMVTIAVYDPDTGHNLDLSPALGRSWDTSTNFALYGQGDVLLAEKSFAESREYNRRYYQFGPYPKEKGERMGDFYRFKLVATGLCGKDENLYSVRISPEEAEAYVYDFTFRLLEEQGSKMYFYIQVPEGTKSIVVENYDIDIDGGESELIDMQSHKRYKINDSLSGRWAQTIIDVDTSQPMLWEYVLTKKTQKRANAGLQVKDECGNLLPIFFRKVTVKCQEEEAHPQSVLPQISCRICNDTYIFDATQSFDQAQRKLSYFWDFGDGLTSNEPVVTHTYKKEGEYTVRLLVRNDSGLECDKMEVSRKVKVNRAPEISVSYPSKVCPAEVASFDASATRDDAADALTYNWDFGDGSTGQGSRVTKIYNQSGRYKVTLTVDDREQTPCSVVTQEMFITVIAPPLADIGGDVQACLAYNQEYKVVLQAAAVKGSDNSNLVYRWDFGDGTTGTGRDATHVYSKGGVYTVRLTVDEGSQLPCSLSTASATLTLNRQPLAEAGLDVLTDIGSEVVFDGSASRCEDDCALSYNWDFGDGYKQSGLRVTHAYQKGGKYMALLAVDDGKANRCSTATDSLVVNVNTPPSLVMAQVDGGCVDREIDFDASASSDADANPLKYIWDFGDGTVSAGNPQAKHKYSKCGDFTVTVTVDDQMGTLGSKSSQGFQVHINCPPVADVGPNLVCCVDQAVEFDAAKSKDANAGDSLTYSWDFGDGYFATGIKVTHAYTKPGKYKVTLTVKDSSGTPCDSSTDTFEAQVSANPVAVMVVR